MMEADSAPLYFTWGLPVEDVTEIEILAAKNLLDNRVG
jgi:hypothetical protein